MKKGELLGKVLVLATNTHAGQFGFEAVGAQFAADFRIIFS